MDRKGGRRRAGGGKRAETKKTRSHTFHVITEGLYELQLGARVALDLLVTLDGELMTFVRVDGELLVELPILGQA